MFELTKKQSTTLESLRALSAFTVMIAHCYIIFLGGRYPEYYPLAALFAQSSVMVFFVLSGFLIGLSVNNNLTRNSGNFDIGNYVSSRFYRIYPPLIFSLALTAILSMLSIYVFNMPDGKPLSVWARMPGYSLNFIPSQYFSTLTFSNYLLNQGVSSNGSLWSLPIEVWCYAVAGLLFVRNYWVKILAVCFFLILQYMHIKFRLFSVVWGISFLMAFAMPTITRFRHTVAVCLVASAAFAFIAKTFFIEFITTKVGLYFNFYFGFSFLFLLLAALKANIGVNILGSHARYSYSLYLIHFPVLIFTLAMMMRFGVSNGHTDILAFAITPVVCILITCKSALIFENRKRIQNIFSN